MTIKTDSRPVATQGLRLDLAESAVTGSSPQKEMLKHLDKMGIDWHITEEGTLWYRIWQVGAENFAPVEQIAELRQGRNVPNEVDAMEWVSRNLSKLKERYSGKWIAVVNGEVVAASADMSDLMEQVHAKKIEKPFVTQISKEPIVWTTAYANQAV